MCVHVFVCTPQALVKGVRDALANSGTTTLTTYLDLGGSVVLLWYGGLMVLREEGITVGDLVSANHMCLRLCRVFFAFHLNTAYVFRR